MGLLQMLLVERRSSWRVWSLMPPGKLGPHQERKGDRELALKPERREGHSHMPRHAARSPRADSPSEGSPVPPRLLVSRMRDDKRPWY